MANALAGWHGAGPLFMWACAATAVACLGFLGLVLALRSRRILKRQIAKSLVLSPLGEGVASTVPLQSVLDALPLDLWVKDVRRRVVLVNSRSVERWGMPAEQLIGRTYFGMMAPSTGEKEVIDQSDHDVLVLGEERRYISDVTTAGGLRSTWRMVKVPLRDGNGQVVGLVGMAENLAHILAAEREVAESRATLRAVLDALPESVYLTDLEGRYRMVNSSLAARCNKQPEEMLGTTEREVSPFDAENARRVWALDEQAIATRTPGEIADMFRVLPGGETRWERILKVPLCMEDGTVFGLVGIIQDLTERRRREEDRLTLERLLHRTENLENLGAMAGSIAHEFNNLLQRMLGHAELALLDVEPSHPAREAIQMVQEAGTSAAKLIKQMLTLSGRSRYVLEPVNLADISIDTAKELQDGLGPTQIRLPSRPTAVPVLADRLLINQVLQSLIHNAAEAMEPGGGEIVLEVGTLSLGEQRLDDSYSAQRLDPGRYGFIEIRDSGPGIPADRIARIYEPFFSTKSMRQGMGLAAVRGIVHGHRGAIHVRSQLGVGTTFRVLLPATAA